MKTLMTGLLMVLAAQSAFANDEGTPVSSQSRFAANLVREPMVASCIDKVEQANLAVASIQDIRVLDQRGKYEITLFLIQGGDIAMGNAVIRLQSKSINFPFGSTYDCDIVQMGPSHDENQEPRKEEGTSMGAEARLAANLVREPVVANCLDKLERASSAHATVEELLTFEQNGKYQMSVVLLQGDVGVGTAELSLQSKPASLPWGGTTYDCTVSKSLNLYGNSGQ